MKDKVRVLSPLPNQAFKMAQKKKKREEKNIKRKKGDRRE